MIMKTKRTDEDRSIDRLVMEKKMFDMTLSIASILIVAVRCVCAIPLLLGCVLLEVVPCFCKIPLQVWREYKKQKNSKGNAA